MTHLHPTFPPVKFIIAALLCLGIGCGGAWRPPPDLMDKTYEVQENCVYDYGDVPNACAVLDDGVQRDCLSHEDNCVPRFQVGVKGKTNRFIFTNLELPCYPDWMVDVYSDPEGQWYEHGRYRAVEFLLGGYVSSATSVKDATVHLFLVSNLKELQSPRDKCLYTVEASIEHLVGGSYGVKLWNEQRELMLSLHFIH